MELEIKDKKSAGFTLIELVVAMFAFGLIVVSIGGVAQSVIKAQRKAFAIQSVQESSRYIMESMSKEIRMSVVNSASADEIDTLNITNSRGETFDYQFDGVNNRLLRNGEFISPSDVDLTGKFYIRKYGAPANRVLVTVIMKVKSENLHIEEQSEVYLQSSISARSF